MAAYHQDHESYHQCVDCLITASPPVASTFNARVWDHLYLYTVMLQQSIMHVHIMFISVDHVHNQFVGTGDFYVLRHYVKCAYLLNGYLPAY